MATSKKGDFFFIQKCIVNVKVCKKEKKKIWHKAMACHYNSKAQMLALLEEPEESN